MSPNPTLRSVSAAFAFLQKGHIVFEKTMTLLLVIAVFAVSRGLALIEKDDLMIPPKLCLILLFPKKAVADAIMTTKTAILEKKFI